MNSLAKVFLRRLGLVCLAYCLFLLLYGGFRYGLKASLSIIFLLPSTPLGTLLFFCFVILHCVLHFLALKSICHFLVTYTLCSKRQSKNGVKCVRSFLIKKRQLLLLHPLQNNDAFELRICRDVVTTALWFIPRQLWHKCIVPMWGASIGMHAA